MIDAVRSARAAGDPDRADLELLERRPLRPRAPGGALRRHGDLGRRRHAQAPARDLPARRRAARAEPREACVFVDDLRENCDGAEAVGMTALLHRDPAETIADARAAAGAAASLSPTADVAAPSGLNPAAIRTTPVRARATPSCWIRARRSARITRARMTVTIGNSEPPTATSESRPIAGDRDQGVGGGVEAPDREQRGKRGGRERRAGGRTPGHGDRQRSPQARPGGRPQRILGGGAVDADEEEAETEAGERGQRQRPRARPRRRAGPRPRAPPARSRTAPPPGRRSARRRATRRGSGRPRPGPRPPTRPAER